MSKKLIVIGIVLIFIGAILVIGFWPLIGKDCQTVEDGNYSHEDSVTIYGEIEKMRYVNIKNNANLILIEGSSYYIETNGTFIFTEGDFVFFVENKNVTANFEKGDQIYATIVYKEVEIGPITFHYWTSSEINSTSSVNLTFFIVIIVGAALIMIGAIAGLRTKEL
jgi:hypothetical protein